MRPPAFEAATVIATLPGFGTFSGSADWSTYVGKEPSTPANVVTCYDTGGTTGLLADIQRPTIQVRVRSAEYEPGWAKANEILIAFYSIITRVANQTDIFAWTPSTGVAFIGRDDSDRFLFTVNFNLIAQTGL